MVCTATTCGETVSRAVGGTWMVHELVGELRGHLEANGSTGKVAPLEE